MLNYERIPNMASKFKKKHLTFWHENCENLTKSCMLPTFDSFWPKRGQMLFDLNFDAIFGVLSSFSTFYHTICCNFHILNFWPPCYFLIKNAGRARIFNLNLQLEKQLKSAWFRVGPSRALKSRGQYAEPCSKVFARSWTIH